MKNNKTTKDTLRKKNKDKLLQKQNEMIDKHILKNYLGTILN